jgi:hypothetical protein
MRKLIVVLPPLGRAFDGCGFCRHPRSVYDAGLNLGVCGKESVAGAKHIRPDC